MNEIRKLAPYRDERGNEIIYAGKIDKPVLVNFHGSNNRLIISDGANIAHLNIQFDRDNATAEFGSHKGVGPLRLFARLGQDARVIFGNNVSTTEKLAITVAEGASLTIGEGVMIAAQVEIRCDDSHPIFDVETGLRANPSRSINIGNHVWIAKRAVIMGGTSIGDGSVVGLGAVVTKDIPNNCVAAGIPARVVRKNVAWERPHLSMHPPAYKPDASTIRKTEKYWNLTEIEPVLILKKSFTERILLKLGYQKIK